MGLELVSLTGADDNIAPQSLKANSARFPTVEWAILYFPEREGSPRNPSSAWRELFLEQGMKFAAAHLCGTQVFREILDPELAQKRIADLQRYRRVQININARRPEFTASEVLSIYRTLHTAGIRMILQHHDESAPVIAQFLREIDQDEGPQVDVLFDASRGKGVQPDQWPAPFGLPTFTGYAGGLGPDNVATELRKITATIFESGADAPFWIDMETGIRTNNAFDLYKVERVLEECSLV